LIPNPKSEFRNTKQITIIQIPITQTN
jgi:hypothetical protein